MPKKTNTDVHDEHDEDAVEIDADEFNLDDWIGGIEQTVRSVTIYAAGHLVERTDVLNDKLRIARKIAPEDRGINDETPESIEAELVDLYTQFEQSGRRFKVQARSQEWISERLADEDDFRDKKSGEVNQKKLQAANVEAEMSILADSIISPKGVTVEHLRRLYETSDTQYRLLIGAFRLASERAPKVDLPFSRAGSTEKGRRESS